MKLRLAALFLTCMMASSSLAAGLKDYVVKPDSTYTYTLHSAERVDNSTVCIIDMTSQNWQGISWQHWVSIIAPSHVTHPDTALLVIYGSRNNEKPPTFFSDEARVLVKIAEQTGAVVAVVSQVPNGPLFDGKTEDAIMAYTYEKFLQGEGDEWPLLRPMVKSAVRAMDTIQSVVKANFGHEVQKFVLTGTSKRGWTAWLTAAVDDRVVGIAPMAFDALNMRAQMEHQLKTYGEYSEKMGEYTNKGMQACLDTPQGQRLLDMVDPYSYRKQLTLPKLIVRGTNDPYWTADALDLYLSDLEGPKYIHYEPNKGHDLGLNIVPEVTAFFNAILTKQPMPQLEWKCETSKLVAKWSDPLGEATLWQAKSKTRDFREAKWWSTPLTGVNEAGAFLPTPKKGWAAYYISVTFPLQVGSETSRFSLCTPITIVPQTFAEPQ